MMMAHLDVDIPIGNCLAYCTLWDCGVGDSIILGNRAVYDVNLLYGRTFLDEIFSMKQNLGLVVATRTD